MRLLRILVALLLTVNLAAAQNTPVDSKKPVYADVAAEVTADWNFSGAMSHFTLGKVICKAYDDTGHNGTQTGRMLEQKVATEIDFGAQAPGGQTTNFSQRCVGFIRANFTETYTFYVTTEEGARLWVNGSKIVDQYVAQSGPQTFSGTFAATAGQWYPILIDHYEDASAPDTLTLEWQSASQTREVVPSSAYAFSGDDSAPTVLGSATVLGRLAFGRATADTEIDLTGGFTFRDPGSPPPTAAGKAVLYYNGTDLLISKNGGGFVALASGSAGGWLQTGDVLANTNIGSVCIGLSGVLCAALTAGNDPLLFVAGNAAVTKDAQGVDLGGVVTAATSRTSCCASSSAQADLNSFTFAGPLSVGRVIRLTASGHLNRVSGVNSIVRIFLGGTQIGSIQYGSTGSSTWYIDATITVRTAGASGVVAIAGVGHIEAASSEPLFFPQNSSATVSSVNLNGTPILKLTGQTSSSSDPSNIVAVDTFSVTMDN